MERLYFSAQQPSQDYVLAPLLGGSPESGAAPGTGTDRDIGACGASYYYCCASGRRLDFEHDLFLLRVLVSSITSYMVRRLAGLGAACASGSLARPDIGVGQGFATIKR